MFDDIRPFQDDEVPAVLAETLNDPELAKALSAWVAPTLHRKYPRIVRQCVRLALKVYFLRVKTVYQFQMRLAPIARRLIYRSVSEFTVHGLEKLDRKKAYLFVSNHRDIVMDPAMVNWALYQSGFQTVQIAIGDNLLTKPFASNLMRLNKSFIVQRGIKGMKAKFKAAQHLSKYIHHAILEQGANVWIAQREGRAKDGYDKTNSAIIGMFSLSRPKPVPYADYINELNIVPVAISYELDPTDTAKARELHAQATKGEYRKKRNEDLTSIAKGMVGWKGHVHLEFGQPLVDDFESDTDVADAIDQQIRKLYRLFDTHQWAAAKLSGQSVDETSAATQALSKRVAALPDDLSPFLLKQYANSVRMTEGKAPWVEN